MKHFKPSDFACSCCGALPQQRLMDRIDFIREAYGHPITITSGKRCEKHNKGIGGAPKSRHVSGDAADLVRTPELLAFLLPRLAEFGVCMEDPDKTIAGGGWIHLDLLNRNGWRVFKI